MKKKLLPFFAMPVMLAVFLIACNNNAEPDFVLPNEAVVFQAANRAAGELLRDFEPLVEITAFTTDYVNVTIEIVDDNNELSAQQLEELEVLIRTLVTLSLTNRGIDFPGEVKVEIVEAFDDSIFAVTLPIRFTGSNIGIGPIPDTAAARNVQEIAAGLGNLTAAEAYRANHLTGLGFVEDREIVVRITRQEFMRVRNTWMGSGTNNSPVIPFAHGPHHALNVAGPGLRGFREIRFFRMGASASNEWPGTPNASFVIEAMAGADVIYLVGNRTMNPRPAWGVSPSVGSPGAATPSNDGMRQIGMLIRGPREAFDAANLDLRDNNWP